MRSTLDFTLTIPSMQVDDIAVYNRLFPDKWDMELLGGSGSLSGRFAVNAKTLHLDLDLASDDASLRLAGYPRRWGPARATARGGREPRCRS